MEYPFNHKKQKLDNNKEKVMSGKPIDTVNNNGLGYERFTQLNHTNDHVLPTYNEKKYDRQLRLWASSGQNALENSHILLIGATSTGCELIKNLILPGVGQVSIFDNSIVSDQDVEGNFFLADDDLGKVKSKSVAELLNELNPQMKCKGIDGVLFENAIDNSVSAINFSQFNLVIASGIGPSTLLQLYSTLKSLNIPLIIADSIGFYGYLRICLPSDHTIVESHPDSLADLRLDTPWDELIEYSNKFENLDKFSDSEIEHIPFVILLIILSKKWKQIYGKEPTTYEEKNDFKKFIIKSTNNREGDFENFEEAVSSTWKLSQSSKSLSSDLEKILYHKSSYSQISTSQFWALVAALRIFYEQPDSEGTPSKLLPLSGVLPDMKTSTEWFVELQTIYKKKAADDIKSIKSILESLPTSIAISDELISTFCKNSRYIHVLSGSSLEYSTDQIDNSSIQPEDFDIYLAIRAYKSLHEKNGNESTSLDTLTKELDIIASQFSTSVSLSSRKIAEELTRASGELYNIASFMGGVGAQEAVKIVTHQYVPLNNTLVYDGIVSRTGAFNV